jgi:hypothetical protein
MHFHRKRFIGILLVLLLAACQKQEQPPRNVLLLYSAGFNDLSYYLLNNISALEQGRLPENTSSGPDDVLLVYSRQPVQYNEFSTKTPSYLIRFYADKDGSPHRDTLKTWDKDCAASSRQTMQEVFRYVKQEFPAQSFGAVFSSHSSGWLPTCYYLDPAQYEYKHAGEIAGISSSPSLKGRRLPAQEVFPPLEVFPPVKSIGQDTYGSEYIEMELRDFTEALPYKLDYLLIDACLAGGVELAYALRGKADIVGFSPAEVMAKGFNYSTLTRHLLRDKPDPVAVCRDYYEYYDAQSDSYRSATISVVDTRALEPLTGLCKTLFEKYRTQISQLDGNDIQGYFRSNRHYFYDLKDILVHAGIDTEEQSALESALNTCLLYKAATPSFISYEIKSFSGFSMYLPSRGTPLLDKHYRTNIAWNQATGLVE